MQEHGKGEGDNNDNDDDKNSGLLKLLSTGKA
jgi:hypothetical protein